MQRKSCSWLVSKHPNNLFCIWSCLQQCKDKQNRVGRNHSVWMMGDILSAQSVANGWKGKVNLVILYLFSGFNSDLCYWENNDYVICVIFVINNFCSNTIPFLQFNILHFFVILTKFNTYFYIWTLYCNCKEEEQIMSWNHI